MNLNSQTIAALTRAIFDRLQSSGMVPRFVQATTVESGTTPTVLVNGTSEPIQANALGDPAAVDEVVWCVQWLGTTLVVGRAGGVRLYGYAFGATDDPFTTAEVLSTLTVDVVVTQPGRVLRIDGRGLFSVDTNGASVLMRVTQDGVVVQRIAQHGFPTASVGEYMTGFALVEDLDPGGYTFAITGECVGGIGTFAGATSRGAIVVSDAGPVMP